MKKLLLSFLCCMLAVIGMQAEEVTATLSFADVAQRTEYSTEKQVWSQNGITLTNNKGDSSTSVGDYSDPVRFYKNSQVIVEFTQEMSKIEFACNTTTYANDLSNSIKLDGVASVSGKIVTVTLNELSKTFNIGSLSAQVRVDYLTVYTADSGETPGEGGGEIVDVAEPTFTPESNTEFEEFLDVTINVAEGLSAYYSTDNKVSYTQGTTFTIAETTTVYAYAEDVNGNKSDVVSAKYTKNVPLPENTIVFNSTEGSDGTQSATADNFITTYIKETNIEGLTCTATNNCYKGKADYGMKMSTGSVNGSFTLKFASAMNVTSIVVNAVNYNTDVAKLSVNDLDAQSLTDVFTDYTFEVNSEITELTVKMTKRGYIKSLTINVTDSETPGEGGEDPGEDPVEPTPDPEQPLIFGPVQDFLNNSFIGISGTTYSNWSGKVGNSGTRYLGQSAGGNDAIQLRTAGNSGIVTDISVGTVNKITVSWNSNTADGRILQVYGRETAYTSATELYSNDTKGTLLGQIEKGTDTNYVVVVDGDYEYIGLRSKEGAMYIDEIIIEWYIPYPENITSNQCYNLAVGTVWDEPEGCWYAANFINANTGEQTWSVASAKDTEYNGYIFYLAPGNTPIGHEPQLDPDYKYTHVEFVQIPATVEEPADIRTLNLYDVEYRTTGVQWYDGVSSKTYSLAEDNWMAVGTGLNRVALSEGIGYAYGVVSAEGAIEVYNVNGAVVARGNDSVDLRGLGRGVYIIRSGNQVRKVVR